MSAIEPAKSDAGDDDAASDLMAVATSFAVRGELTARLAQLHESPFDRGAQLSLDRYLASDRLAAGTEAWRTFQKGV